MSRIRALSCCLLLSAPALARGDDVGPKAPAPPPPAAAPGPAEPGREEPKGQQAPRDTSTFNLGEGALAIAGYDPVAYFPEGGGKPKKGLERFSATVGGVVYRFASAEHRDLFAKDAAKYEPQYGGWCAYGCAKRAQVEIDPESFLVTDGKLYLFFDGLFADTRASWLEDPESLRPKADDYWKGVVEQAEKDAAARRERKDG